MTLFCFYLLSTRFGLAMRAVHDDETVQLVVLQRTAENKFLRLSVSDSTELQFTSTPKAELPDAPPVETAADSD